MTSDEIHIVTGAFGYSGKYIAKQLLDEGYRVRTLTDSVNRINPFGGRIKAYPFNFNNPERLVESLKGASVLYNTYWVRFNYAEFRQSIAVTNTIKLFNAAKRAGVKRIVHISITNPSEDSHLEYFKRKARLERALIESGISYAILRPALLFGREDILINNIAWMLRRFPVFGVFGDGNYKLRPIYIDDLARLSVKEGKERENRIIDAVGPETFTYLHLVREIGRVIGKERHIIFIPDAVGYFFGWIIGKVLGDIVITRDEIEGLEANLLYADSPAVGSTRLTDWARENSSVLGLHYASELARRRNRIESYEKL
ncbi:MAG: epimerase [Nitrospinae bacterium RIFCSPLOWO2_02_FULL_39_110]|nr:MAG: epimerase [Nitrospinae bacterium RIFCSPHIGHO2_02_39_11]OGW00459.1 MAG: epimerase [Nitrospinae bacterium RIFCSPHIGHO2_12_FULL_39_42]OGW02753.1 MAG: epimerase [Nitrospinae bacterium RIFCSPHIGHO2_02_FULL_39_82]OGW04238.1 MAG: epimerase [Nitrospinae bacterium RIFCSPLOWO2_02_FULL_39_110]OGW06100.1 MAG: epimerase [Nitrospinae bacterium RIFCSPLOWO2_02_39_17]OGW09580.1 MAG: epimerase [Nitrospinae bacterium RIFCSPLOWO2_12_FULL_39_93]OGW11091.1 MAG: epimerase [Nitrospinae bacterium RIFCSPLOWO2_